MGFQYIRLPSYEKRLALIKLPPLKRRRKMLNAVFLLKLINGVINSQFLLEILYIRVPVRPTRYYNFINIKYYATNTMFRQAFLLNQYLFI